MHWRRKWQPTPVFLPGESQGQGSLVSYTPWGPKESDKTVFHWLGDDHKDLMSVQFSSVTQSCPTLCNTMDCSMPGQDPLAFTVSQLLLLLSRFSRVQLCATP